MTQKVKRDTMRDLCDGVTCGAGGGVGGTAAGRLVALAATSALPVTPALAVVPLRAFSVNGMPFGGSGSGRFETGGTSWTGREIPEANGKSCTLWPNNEDKHLSERNA